MRPLNVYTPAEMWYIQNEVITMKKKIVTVALVLLVAAVVNSMILRLDRDAEGTITYLYGDTAFSEPLTSKEVGAVVRILDGKMQTPDNPSCGFSEDIAVTIDGVTFALACDQCGLVKNCETGWYIRIHAQERIILEALFLVRGGKFPCV